MRCTMFSMRNGSGIRAWTSAMRPTMNSAHFNGHCAVAAGGPGVSDEEQTHIFEPGVRGRAQRASGNGGAELGLALARRLARSIEGDVVANAAVAAGRFLVRLASG